MAYVGGELYYGIEEPNREQLQKMLSEVLPRDPAVATSTGWWSATRPRPLFIWPNEKAWR